MTETDKGAILKAGMVDWGQRSINEFGSEEVITKEMSIEEIITTVNREYKSYLASALSVGASSKQQLATITAKTTKGQLEIGRNLDVESEEYNALGWDPSKLLTPSWRSYTRRTVLADLRNKRVYKNERNPDSKKVILDSLGRAWLMEQLEDLAMSDSEVPASMTFDQALEKYYVAYAKHLSRQAEDYNAKTSEINKLVVDMASLYHKPQKLVETYEQILMASKSRQTLSDAEYAKVKQLMDENYGKRNFEVEEAATLITREVHPGAPESSPTHVGVKNRMVRLIRDYRELMDQILPGFSTMINEMGDTGQPLYELVEREKLLRDFKAKQALIECYLTTYTELVEQENDAGILSDSNVSDLVRLEEQGKYRGVLLQVLARAHTEGLQDVFESSRNFPTYDNLMATKGADFRTKQFLLDGIKSSNDQSLVREYQALRMVKDSLGLMNLMTSQERLERGVDETTFYATYREIREKERNIFLRVTKNANYGQLAERYAVTWKMISDNLKNGEVFVDIERIPNENRDSIKYMFVSIKPQESPVIFIDSAPYNESIERNYAAYRAAIRRKTEFPAAYQRFWGPIRQLIGNAKKVYISPDGIYHGIALNGLKNSSNDRFLFEEHDIVRLADVSDIKKYFASTPVYDRGPIENIYLFGNPDYDRLDSDEPVRPVNKSDTTRSASRSLIFARKGVFKPFDPLPNTQPEIDSIAYLSGQRKLKVSLYAQLAANEQNFNQMSDPDIVHLATHGMFYDGKKGIKSFKKSNRNVIQENPLLKSHFYLSGANKALRGKIEESNDGVITGEDVAHMDFSGTELVVLSACETGLGEQLDGEGVFGLQRSFLTAGAKSVIVSLWTVNDLATSKMMTAFYENWLIKKQPKRLAFRNAQKALWAFDEKYKAPYFWSPFILLGE